MGRTVITQRTDTLTHPRLGWHLLWMLHMAFFLCLLSANACASKEKIEGSRMETDGEWRYGYNKDGNLVERYKGSGKWWDVKREHWKYAWNDFVKPNEQSGTCSGFAMARNRILKNQNGSLAGVQRPDRHGHWVEFTYDALGRRLSKSASERTNWLWNGNVPLHEWTSGQRYEDKGWKPYEEDFKTWIFEENSFVPLALLQDGHTYSIMTDHLGTPTEMYDENGEEVWYRRLDMNGKIIKEECHRRTSYYKNVTVPFLFQGQYYDYETELAYNRFRYYSPNMGCYISQDPIRLAGGKRLYGYVKDPNTYIDLLGLKGCYLKEAEGDDHDYVLEISHSVYPETTEHIAQAIKDGKAEIVTIDRANAGSRRKDSLRGVEVKKGKDRDEWPMAMFEEGGEGADVKHISPQDNRGAGSSIRAALQNCDENIRIKIKIVS